MYILKLSDFPIMSFCVYSVSEGEKWRLFDDALKKMHDRAISEVEE